MRTRVIFLILFLAQAGRALTLFDSFTVQPWLTYSLENRWEMDSSQNLVSRGLSPVAVGFSIYPVIWYFEYGSFTETSGGASLSVQRKFENYLLGASYYNIEWKFGEHMVPYFGVAVGTSLETVDTTLTGATTRDVGQNYFASDVHLGVFVNATDFLWVSAEARLLFGEKTSPTPQISLLGRLGFWFR